ncbi:exosome complex RNA-binding protein Csl4 [Archaeoglobus veneficus]|nr:exosome complex RNA-binding protein Csl4 [Archaeoglobus veneficus]
MKFVMPGDRIGLVEEYVTGSGVYEENGEIFAAVAGKVVVKDRTVSVEPVKRIPHINKGDVVLGRVVDVRNSMALIELARKKGFDRSLMHTGIAALHVSNVQRDYLKDINEAIRYMDIIKARVIDAENLKLSTKEPEMGVLKSLCSVCKHELVREGNTLKCPNCGNVEKRKMSTDYGKGKW